MASWWQDEEFWNSFAPYFFTEERVEGTAAEVEKLVALLGLAPSAKVLDLCCGIGRHAVELAWLGYSVTALVLTESFLVQARERAQHATVPVHFVQSHMRDFVR